MANINSLTSSSSSSSSIYGTRNVLSGLASGLDTETLIENSISGYQTKIQTLLQKQQQLVWKQTAYRSITDKLIDISQKYTSYTSTTNLGSLSFFNNATITSANGDYANKVAATGKTTSDLRINSIEQLATKARYSVDASTLNSNTLEGTGIDWSESVNVGDISGTMTFTYGTKTISISFDESDCCKSADELASLITKKLGEQTMTTSDGSTVKASTRIGVSVSNGTISFNDLQNAGNSVYISGVTGDIKSTLGVSAGTLSDGNGRSISVGSTSMYHTEDMATYLSDRTISVTLDGTTKEISMGTLTGSNNEELTASLVSNLSKNLKTAFGSKVTVEANENGGITFNENAGGSSLLITSDYNTNLGLGKTGLSNYFNTSTSLGEILGDKLTSDMALDAVGNVTYSNGVYSDSEGNTVKYVDGEYKRVDNDGNLLYGITINGKTVGAFTADTAFETVMNKINSSTDVDISYSQLTNKFTFTSDETGADARIDFGDGLATALFGEIEANTDSGGYLVNNDGERVVFTDENGENYCIKQMGENFFKFGENGSILSYISLGTFDDLSDEIVQQVRKGYTKGTDAIVNITVNGDNITLQRSSNVISMDGLSVTLSNTFNEGLVQYSGGSVDETATKNAAKALDANEYITFTTKSDADKIVTAIQSFVDEINTVMAETHEAYSTQPLTDSSNNRYMPLTDDDKADLTDSEIEAYEEKAKTGLLFGDSDLSQLYSRLRTIISSSGNERKALEAIGLTTTYSDGVTSWVLDETKLREALETNPDSVRDAFVTTDDEGNVTGLIATLSKTLTSYSSTSSAGYGILVRKAGTTKSSLSLSDNSLQDQIDNLDDQIEKWRDKMSDKIDYYTTQFTNLEVLIQELNSQSSTLSSLMGY